MSLLELRGISLAYADAPVLTGVDLAVEEGELVLVTGATGSGKSTLLGIVTGLVPRFSGGHLTGEVLLDGTSVLEAPPRERAHAIGFVGQDPLAGFVTDTVEEELAYGMEQLGLLPETMRRRVEETLDLLGIADLRSRDLRTLSGGQQQRVAIGSVLTMHPRLIVLDEPTSALDPTAAEEVLATLTRLVHDVGVSVLLAEHRLERVIPFADRICLVTPEGRLQVGDPAEVLATSPVVPPLVELARAAGWSPLPLSVRDARRRAGTLALTPPSEAAPAPEPPDVVVRGLTVVHGRTVAVRDVSLSLPRGRVTAVMGRNGSGKSSLLWALQGSGPRRAGQVTIGGADPADLKPVDRRSLVGLLPQQASDLLYLETVDEECAAGGPDTRAILDTLAPGIPGDQHPRDLSEGQRLALALSLVLAGGPSVVLLDEPTRGLDYRAKRVLAAGAAPARRRGPDRAGLHPRRGVHRAGRRRGGGARRGRDRLVRAGTPGGRRVAGVRAAGDQGARPAVAARRRGRPGPGGAPMNAVPVSRRSAVILGVASLGGLMMLVWPLLLRVQPNDRIDPPFLFLALLPIVIAVVLAELSDGGLDTRVLAVLGVLSAVIAILRGLSAGTGGVELVFFLLVLAGRVFGPGFGFVLGVTSLFASALLTAGVGPWLPFQMLVSAWVGMGAGLLPRRVTGRAEIAMLAAYGVFAAYAYGLLMNLSGWPFLLGIVVPGHEQTALSFDPQAPLTENLSRFAAYSLITSTGSFDTGRAITNAVAIVVVGPAVLTTLRRAAKRATVVGHVPRRGSRPNP